MDELVIRPARPGDGADLARGWLEVGAYYTALAPELFQVPAAEGLAEWVEGLLARPAGDDTIWLVAEVAGRVVGEVQARLDRPVADARWQLVQEVGQTRVFVNALAVEESSRRRGMGTRLMQAVEAWGRERGARLVALDTYVASPLSVPFYEQRMGYQRRAVVFQKRLD